jgi:hypothetical protein
MGDAGLSALNTEDLNALLVDMKATRAHLDTPDRAYLGGPKSGLLAPPSELFLL